jgi:hypothetical protein
MTSLPIGRATGSPIFSSDRSRRDDAVLIQDT